MYILTLKAVESEENKFATVFEKVLFSFKFNLLDFKSSQIPKFIRNQNDDAVTIFFRSFVKVLIIAIIFFVVNKIRNSKKTKGNEI